MQTARRYANNTTTVPVDRRRALGFAPGLRMSMSPQGSNLPGYNIPSGKLLIFNPRVNFFLRDGYKQVTHVTKPGATPEQRLAMDGASERSGSQYADAVAAKFQGGKVDFGFRRLEMLDDLNYDPQTGEDDADRYFAVLYPKITCEMGLEVENPRGASGDVINDGEPLPCPTCRMKWLTSDACLNAIDSSPLNRQKLMTLRSTLIDSFDAGIRAATHFLGKVQAQIDAKNSAKTYQDSDYHFMQMLHKKPAHVEQAEIQTAAAEATGRAMAESLRDVFQPPKDPEYEEFLKWKASQAEVKVEEPQKRGPGNPNFKKKEQTE